MKNVIFASNTVGYDVVSWLASNYPEDMHLVVVSSEDDIVKFERIATCEVIVHQNYLEKVEGTRIDFGFLVWWPYIIEKKIIETANTGFFNTHPSFLPYCRGKNYNFWTLVEKVPFGVSIHSVEVGIDCGGIVAQKKIPYSWEDTGKTLYDTSIVEMSALFKTVYPQLRSKTLPLVRQDLSKGSFHLQSELHNAKKIYLDKTYSCRDFLNLLRAGTFAGYSPCYFEDGEKIYEITVSIKERECSGGKLF